MLNELLSGERKTADGKYCALASRWIGGEVVAPFAYRGVRTDDPNDIVPHEDRRMLRGLAVFSAWLNHHDTRSINTMDTLVQNDGRRYIKHYLIDFGLILGSAGYAPKEARIGHRYVIDQPRSPMRRSARSCGRADTVMRGRKPGLPTAWSSAGRSSSPRGSRGSCRSTASASKMDSCVRRSKRPVRSGGGAQLQRRIVGIRQHQTGARPDCGRGMVPFTPGKTPVRDGTKVLLASGKSDSIVPLDHAGKLAILEAAGASVSVHWHEGGHELGQDDVDAAREWLAQSAA
jgi:hypothetical protein